MQGNVFVWSLIQNFDRTQLLPVTHFSAHKEYITRILLSPDVKKLATCSADHTAKIWEVDIDQASASAVSSAAATQVQKGVNGNEYRTNGHLLNGSGSGSDPIHPPPPPLVEPKPFPLEATLTGHQRWVWDCAFSADSAYLVTACSDHYARLWELHSQQIIRQYNGHHRGAVCVALNDYSEAR